MLIPPPPNVIKNPHPLLELPGTQFIWPSYVVLNRISEKKDALNSQRILFLPTHGCCNSPPLKGISYDLWGPSKNVLKRGYASSSLSVAAA